MALAARYCVLWDFAVRYFNRPVYRLHGVHRDRIQVYGSTMVGEEGPDEIITLEGYADFVGVIVEKKECFAGVCLEA